jgi:Flp pilus assembly protein TadG
MSPKAKSETQMSSTWLGRLRRAIADRRGAVSPLMTLLLIPLMGVFAVGVETGTWYVFHRSQQNAADSSVIAAAEKGGSGYSSEAQTVATKYGYTDKVNNVTVGVTTPACPTGVGSLVPGTACYQVAVTRNVPLYLASLVGYSGDTTVNGGQAKTIQAQATAGTVFSNQTYCMRAKQDITLDGGGGPPNFNGCSAVAGHDLKCNGTNADKGMLYGDAGNSNVNNSCGGIPRSGETLQTDPVATQVSNALKKLSPSTCPAVSNITTIQQGAVNCFTPTTSGGSIALGNASITKIDVTGQNTIIVIKDGGLNLNGNTLETVQSGLVYGSLTLVFQGTTKSSVITGSGSLNIGAPTSGDWSGIAIAEDPALIGANNNGSACTSNGKSGNGNSCPQDLDFGGNTPNLYITGAVYAPNATFNVHGAINKATAPFPYCIVIDSMYINTAGLLTIYNDNTNNPPTKDCRKAGLNASTIPVVALLN